MQNSFEGAIRSPKNPMFPPAANWFRVDSLNGCPYRWRWAIGVRTITAEAAAAVGKPGADDYQPAVAEQTQFTQLQDGNDDMTPEEWAAWTTQSDNYILEIAAKRKGLELV